MILMTKTGQFPAFVSISDALITLILFIRFFRFICRGTIARFLP